MPKPNLTLFPKTFNFIAPKLLNQLPDTIGKYKKNTLIKAIT